jgi:acetylornithine deacetylase/succinyl-diaminopimelate desuccinylase-like protein
MDFERIKSSAEGYKAAMTKFLRDLIAIPGESAGEEGHIRRIAKEMADVGFDKVVIDPMGNVLGTMGTGKTLIAYDAHIDTVGVGNRANWTFALSGLRKRDEIAAAARRPDGGIVSAATAEDHEGQGLLSDNTPCSSPAPCRRKTATACAGSTSSTRTRCGPSSWS